MPFFHCHCPECREQVQALVKEIAKLSQASDNLTAAVAALTAEVPAVVAALGNPGTPDSVLQPLADSVNSAVSQLQAAVPKQ